ncbi:hypothetical protein IWX90DRAFT_275439 [Phyllosticta citrichinensis]|uniref:SET domain-containing protein n=1 Tax=Phyllosticta citrichinensis TaxID=1130410 RepID=A0ABR1XN77_9PEZI
MEATTNICAFLGSFSDMQSALDHVARSVTTKSIAHNASKSQTSPKPLHPKPDRKEALLDRLADLRNGISQSPYSVALRLQVAELYRILAYPDLAAGEAYKALLLVDEVLDESGEYHDEAWEAAEQEMLRQRRANGAEVQEPADASVEEEELRSWAESVLASATYICLAANLLSCGCLKSAYEFCQRGLKANPENERLRTIQDAVNERIKSHFAARGIDLTTRDDYTVEDYPDRTMVRRELYPWNDHEPDRYSEESLAILNEQIQTVAPKLEARVTELPLLASETTGNADTKPTTIKQLGVFVKENVAPGELILDEKSLLTANARLHDSNCDACGTALPDLHGPKASDCVFCAECDDIVFCSQDCHDLAQESYHTALCRNDVEAIAKDAPAAEAADALYSLLLLRALAMAETQDVHPLDLGELRFIWGDYSFPLEKVTTIESSAPGTDAFGGASRTLPFSFSANVMTPLHMLEKMDLNIFTMDKYDFWILNTLYAKFRGTASARQGRDGKPDVGAVHPLWCLANHSCDPNVRWDWDGNMRFWAREERVQWKRRQEQAQAGLRRGEEIFSHYCDIDLPAKERREWAEGALGGMCMCERCVWESTLVS